jgi:2-keto-4-pentenoate hydratase/2-oxohepta-3-ene-1,7-dioic acid hydratase in catechol pathway
MRLVTFFRGGEAFVGVAVDDEVVDLSAAAPELPATMIELLRAGNEALAAARAAAASGAGRLPLSSVTLGAPVPNPSKFLAAGLNYHTHVAETGRTEIPETPTVFAKMPSCITGPYDEILLPISSEQLDYEGELGFVIGRRCRHVARDEARDVIAGYVVVNDVSVRDWQRATSQWTLGKSFDTHGPMGPWLLTADELGDPHALSIRTLVNGEVRQEASTGALIHDCFTLVEHVSKVCTLEPGDVIATGTPAGVAAAMSPSKWLTAGDVVRVEIDGIGAIENRVAAETATQPLEAVAVAGATQ